MNQAVLGLLEAWADRGDVAIRHVTGRRDHAEVLAARPTLPPGGLLYDVVAYEDRMPTALAAADVAVTRAGAGTCTELAAFGVPAVMVPLPIADPRPPGGQRRRPGRGGRRRRRPRRRARRRPAGPRAGAAWSTTPTGGASMAVAMGAQARLDAADAVAEMIEEITGG